jgi:hypothetical protein
VLDVNIPDRHAGRDAVQSPLAGENAAEAGGETSPGRVEQLIYIADGLLTRYTALQYRTALWMSHAAGRSLARVAWPVYTEASAQAPPDMLHALMQGCVRLDDHR